MTNPAFTQVTFRGRNDDGSESGATWKATQGTDWTQDTGVNFRVRFRIDETNSRAWTNKNWNLYYQINTGGYSAVTGSTQVQFSLSSNFADGDDCTTQLTGGTGTFVTDNNGMKETTGGATNSGSAGYLFEVEFCLILDSGQLTDADTINLRIYDGSSAIAAYTDTPVITVNIPQQNIDESVSLAKFLGITSLGNLVIYESATTLQKFHGITTAVIGVTEESVTLTKIVTEGESGVGSFPEITTLLRSDALNTVSLTNENDSVSLNRLVGITILDQANDRNESVTLGRTVAITPYDQLSKDEGINLGYILAIIPTAQASDRNDGTTLTYIIAIAPSSETNESDTVSLGRIITITTNDQTNEKDSVILGSISSITSVSQTNENDIVNLLCINNIIPSSQTNENDWVTFTRSNGITISEETQGQLSESITLSSIFAITIEEHQTLIHESVTLSRSDGITLPQDQSLVNNSVTLTRSDIISPQDQLLIDSNITLTRILTIAIEEHQTLVHESVTLSRSDGITLPQDQSIVNNSITFARLDTILISEEAQGQVNESVILNRFSSLNNNTQVAIQNNIELSKLFGLLPTNYLYLDENISLEYNKGLATDSIRFIFEQILLRRIVTITPLTLLIALSSINLGRFNSIVGEPPSLYVFADGSRAAAVLFRDKRAHVLWRDKRGG